MPFRSPEVLPSEQSMEKKKLVSASSSWLISFLVLPHTILPWSLGPNPSSIYHVACKSTFCAAAKFLFCIPTAIYLWPSQASPESSYNYLREPLFQEDRQSRQDEGPWEGTEPRQPSRAEEEHHCRDASKLSSASSSFLTHLWVQVKCTNFTYPNLKYCEGGLSGGLNPDLVLLSFCLVCSAPGLPTGSHHRFFLLNSIHQLLT